MARILVAVLGFCLLALAASQSAHAAKRVAFVVGIDAYDNLPEQQQLKKAVNDARATHIKPVRSVAFSPDGKLLASGSGDKTVKLWSPGSIMAAGR